MERRFGLPGKMILRWAISIWRRVAQHRNHVFVLEEKPEEPSLPVGLSVHRIERLVDCTPALRTALQEGLPATAVETVEWELSRGAVLWLGLIGGKLVVASMSRRGKHFHKWFVPLRDGDIVLFRNRTLPECRGQGLCPLLMRYIARHEAGDQGRAFVDCRIYNHASIRSIEKAGFRRIATMKPLKRQEALGD